MNSSWPAWIAIIPAIIVGIGAPALTVWLQNWGKLKEKAQQWKREDDVAALAAEAARKLLLSQEASRLALEENTREASIARQETYSQLSALHTLANSNTTALVRAELDTRRELLTALREIIELKVASGIKPSASALAVIAAAEQRVAELEVLVAERKRADALATMQIEKGQEAGKIADAAAVAAKPAAEKAAREIVPPVVVETVPPVVKTAVKEALAEHEKSKD